MRKQAYLNIVTLFILFLAACSPQAAPEITEAPASATASPQPSATPRDTSTPAPSATAVNTATNTPVPATKTPTRVPATEAADTPASETGTENEVTIAGFSFDPGVLEVKVGTKVTWTNVNSTGHTVTSDTGVFGSSSLRENASFSFTFDEAGDFPYHCGFHPDMTGLIRVVP
jgi:plastocyanin